MTNYEKFLKTGMEKITSSGSYEISSLVNLYIGGYLFGKRDKTKLFNRPIEEVKSELENLVNKDLIKIVTIEDIKMVIESHGESLTDLGAGYEKEFLIWFRQKEPEMYKTWFEKRKDGDSYFMERSHDLDFVAHNLLFQFSNDALYGEINDKHDEYLAEFCNRNLEANKHIHKLLEEKEKGGLNKNDKTRTNWIS